MCVDESKQPLDDVRGGVRSKSMFAREVKEKVSVDFVISLDYNKSKSSTDSWEKLCQEEKKKIS